MLSFLESWDANKWVLLNCLAPAAWETRQDVMRFARRQLVRMKCELFRRGDVRFSSYFHRLQWLGSPNVAQASLEEFVDKFMHANECCLSPSALRARKWLDTRERSLDKDVGGAFARLLDKLMAFTSQPVEVEHKNCKNDMRSETSGSNHAACADRAMCRQLLQRHIFAGGEDVIASSRTKAADPLPLPAPVPGEIEALEDEGAHQEELEALEDEGAHQELVPLSVMSDGAHDVSPLEALRPCGNPKLMYLNYKLALMKASSSRTVPMPECHVLRKRLVSAYDADPGIRTRWRILWRHARRQERHACEAPAPLQDGPRESAVVAREFGCWNIELLPKHGRSQPGAMVVDPEVFAQSAKDKFTSWGEVDASSERRAAEVTIGPDEATPRVSGIRGGWGTITGCWCAHKNVCLRTLTAVEELQFVRLRIEFNRLADEHKKLANAVELVLELKSDADAAGNRFRTYVLLAGARFNPKVQTFVICEDYSHEYAKGTNNFTLREPPGDEGFYLRMMTTPSRLNDPRNPIFRTLLFETSDELAARMSHCGKAAWHRAILDYELDPMHDDLLLMRVKGVGDACEMKSNPKKTEHLLSTVHSYMAMPSAKARLMPAIAADEPREEEDENVDAFLGLMESEEFAGFGYSHGGP